MAQFSQRLLDHISVCLVRHLLEQQLPLVAELLHVDLLLINVHLILLVEDEVIGLGRIKPDSGNE